MFYQGGDIKIIVVLVEKLIRCFVFGVYKKIVGNDLKRKLLRNCK